MAKPVLDACEHRGAIWPYAGRAGKLTVAVFGSLPDKPALAMSTARSESFVGETLSVGLIGCGSIAEHAHIPTLERSRAARLVAVAESDAARRAWVRGRFPGVTLVEDGAELLRDAGIRAVVIALPTGAAASVAEAAFLAGKHVYVEKPGARSASEWQAVVAAWSRSGASGVIGYNFRQNPIFVDAVRRVREGAVGRVLAVQARFTWAPDRVEGWRAQLATGGGVLLDLASHHIDLTSQLLDNRVDRVRCVTRSHRAEEDTAAVSLDFHGGASGQLFVSSAAGAHENRITVVGSAGVLDVDLLDPRPAPVRRRPGRMERARRSWNALQGLHPARVLRSTRHEPSFATALGIFLEGALAGARLRPDPTDGLRILGVIDAARISAAKGGSAVDVRADGT